MLLDEPTEGIQPNIITQIGEVISHLRDQKTMAIVLVEQYFDFAFGLADHIYAVTRGKVVYESKKLNIDVWYDEDTKIWLKAAFDKTGYWEYRIKKVN